MEKITLDLTGKWQFKEYPPSARRMRDLDKADWLTCKTPSSIYTCLINANKINKTHIFSDPEDFTWVAEKSWVFKKDFDLPEDLYKCKKKQIVFEGLDTIAHIWLNEKLILKTDNMFIPHRADITNFIRPKNNQLLIKFQSPLQYAQQLEKRYGKIDQFYSSFSARSYIRKAQYQFGWDFCPPLPGCGIFRPVRLEGFDSARIENIHIRTIDCSQHYADIKVTAQVENFSKSNLQCSLQITGGGLDISQPLRFTAHEKTASTIIRIDRPIMWWPRGYGVQHLYHLNAQLTANTETVDHTKIDFGIRTVRLNCEKNQSRQSFQFEVNGRPIYAKGANWLPTTLFAGSQTDADYEKLLNLTINTNINTLRIWAGGYYENDTFYKLCDHLGILIWQDFMFAAAYYPDRTWFTDSIEQEATAIIKRLRNHPSIILWCGNTEIDSLHKNAALGTNRKFYGESIYHQILPRLVSQLDPDRDYIPTTPCPKSSKNNSPPSSPFSQWNVWKQDAPATAYSDPKGAVPSFLTEFGLQSLPSMNTIKTFCTKDQLKIAGQKLEKHNYSPHGCPRMARYLAELFGTAKNLENYIYLTQLTQARQTKRYVEHLRAHNHLNSGVLFWQLNDPFTAITFSAIDCSQNTKALYYYARRFFAPILITLISDINPTQTCCELSSASVIVINDTPNPLTANLQCHLANLAGKIIDYVELPIMLLPFRKSTPIKLPKAITQPEEPQKSMLQVTLRNDSQILSENIFMYMPDKYVDWPKPHIKTQINKVSEKDYTLTLSSDVITKDMQITTAKIAAISDNFVDLHPNREHKIKLNFDRAITNPLSTIKITSVNQIL